jgi:putative sterol carrier protein
MADSGINQFISRMAGSFNPEKAAGLEATVQLNLSGAHTGNWYLVVKDKQFTVNEGVVANPGLTVSADSEELYRIFSGQMDAMQAFMQGKLKVSGELSLAFKLVGLFKM